MISKFKKFYQEVDDEVVLSCNKFILTVTQEDLDNSDDNTVYLTYVNCVTNEIVVRSHITAQVYQPCVKQETSPIIYIVVDGEITTVVTSTCIDSGLNC